MFLAAVVLVGCGGSKAGVGQRCDNGASCADGLFCYTGDAPGLAGLCTTSCTGSASSDTCLAKSPNTSCLEARVCAADCGAGLACAPGTICDTGRNVCVHYDANGPSCKYVQTPCSALSATQLGIGLCDEIGCHRNFSCTGTASCEAALTSTQSRYPDLNCEQSSPGCSWTGTTCTGVPLPCSDSMYQQNSVACENVGCTLSVTCGGAYVSYDCTLQLTEARCGDYAPFCVWK
jgi:hypothetical protein